MSKPLLSLISCDCVENYISKRDLCLLIYNNIHRNLESKKFLNMPNFF